LAPQRAGGKEGQVNQLYSFGEKIENQYLRFTVLKQNIDEIEKNVGKKYQVVINRNLKLVSEFKQNLKVQMADNESSAINIAVKDASALRGIEFLSNLIDEYLNFNTEKKDQIAENTITYIDQQLSQIQDSLSFRTTAAGRAFRNVIYYPQQNIRPVGGLERIKGLTYTGQILSIHRGLSPSRTELFRHHCPSSTGTRTTC
jgi:hypothetical protein